MMKCQKNKFWIENISNLFCSQSLIPLDGMSLAEQMNSLSRLVIFIFMILVTIGFPFSTLFLLLSLLFIIILYYIQKNNMERFRAENYTPSDVTRINYQTQTPSDVTRINYQIPTPIDDYRKIYDNGNTLLDSVSGVSAGVFNNPNWTSPNQMLVGQANPKTKIQPVIVPPLADLSYWKGTNLVTYPQINEQGNTDLHRSGYIISDREEFTEKYTGKDRHRYGGAHINTKHHDHHTVMGTFNVPSISSGDIETSWGYNPDQLFDYGLPSNLSTPGLSMDPSMKRYNQNLFTQTIQPGVYTRSEIVEPINSNIGISFTQQIPPASSRIDPMTGALLRTEHDPRILEPYMCENISEYIPNESDIYDPRFTGYGTSYRSYNDDALGQTRFYYDDINAIRMPNYICRSNIDTQPFADSYGPIPAGFEKGNPYTGNIHKMAENAFLEGAIQYRTELSERLMRKTNSEQWQRRMAPISKSSGRMLGGLGR